MLFRSMTSLVESTGQLLGESENEITRVSNVSIQCTIAAIVFVFITVLVLFRYNMKSIVNPILIITEASKKLSEGRLDFEIPYSSTNEIGVLADTLNFSVQELEKYVHEIRRAMEMMAAGQLNVTSEFEFRGEFKEIQNSILKFQDVLAETVKSIQQAGLLEIGRASCRERV